MQFLGKGKVLRNVEKLNVELRKVPRKSSQECRKTFQAPEKDTKVLVSQSNANAGKVFSALNICVRPEGSQPKLSVIFNWPRSQAFTN